jgi:hypothetical protein
MFCNKKSWRRDSIDASVGVSFRSSNWTGKAMVSIIWPFQVPQLFLLTNSILYLPCYIFHWTKAEFGLQKCHFYIIFGSNMVVLECSHRQNRLTLIPATANYVKIVSISISNLERQVLKCERLYVLHHIHLTTPQLHFREGSASSQCIKHSWTHASITINPS